MKKTIFITLWIVSSTLFAQNDQLIFVAYNILNYRNYTSNCTASNNNPNTKEQNLNTILNYLNPDLVICNEIGGNSAQPVDLLLQNAFNTNGVTKYDKAQFTNNSFSSLVNMVYFNTEKLVLAGQSWITKDLNGNNLVRVIDVYRFYYKDSLLTAQSDTVFFTVIAAHLKAGNTSGDASQRALATEAVMDYVKLEVDDENVFLLGDLNTYKSQELCYQNLINYTLPQYRFYDPINAPGVWNNNGSFAYLHTQSTHTSGGCFSGGGLDDRFDHILVSDAVINNDDDMEYVNNTYTAVGNDGKHFNKSIIDGTNSSVPGNVLQALYDLSDHLPVAMEVSVRTNGLSTKEYSTINFDVQNPVDNLMVLRNLPQSSTLIIRDIYGNTLYAQELTSQSEKINIATLKSGFYLISIRDANQNITTKKILKL